MGPGGDPEQVGGRSGDGTAEQVERGVWGRLIRMLRGFLSKKLSGQIATKEGEYEDITNLFIIIKSIGNVYVKLMDSRGREAGIIEDVEGVYFNQSQSLRLSGLSFFWTASDNYQVSYMWEKPVTVRYDPVDKYVSVG